jgi:hypothetical protein
MIDINSIIHIENQAFDTEKDIAFLCVKDYQFNNNSVGYKFEKDNIYSVAFAKNKGVVVNGFTLKCTTQKHSFKVIEKQDIETPLINIQDLQPQEELQETQYRFEISGYKQKDGSAFRKNSIYTETEIKEAGLVIEELFEKEAITWLK